MKKSEMLSASAACVALSCLLPCASIRAADLNVAPELALTKTEKELVRDRRRTLSVLVGTWDLGSQRMVFHDDGRFEWLSPPRYWKGEYVVGPRGGIFIRFFGSAHWPSSGNRYADLRATSARYMYLEDGVLVSNEEDIRPTYRKVGPVEGDELPHPPQSWEEEHQLNIRSESDWLEDPDGDGYSNREEFAFRSDPRDQTDHPPPSAKLRFVTFTSEDPPTATVRSILDGKEYAVTNGTTFVFQEHPFLVEFRKHTTPSYPTWRDVGLIDMAGTEAAKRNNHWQIVLFTIKKAEDAESGPRD